MHALLGIFVSVNYDQFQYMLQRSVFRNHTEQNETVIMLNRLNVLTAPKKVQLNPENVICTCGSLEGI